MSKRLDQIAALPLGGRIKVDPWSDRVELSKAKPVALLSAHEKMEFEISPFFPYLTRFCKRQCREGGSDHDIVAVRHRTKVSRNSETETKTQRQRQRSERNRLRRG